MAHARACALPLVEPAVLAFSRVHGPSGPSFANPSPPLGPQKLPSSVIPLQASPDCSIRHLSVACALLAAACLTEAINAATRPSPPQCFLNAMYHPPGRPAGCRRLAFVSQDSWRHQHAAAAFLATERRGRTSPPPSYSARWNHTSAAGSKTRRNFGPTACHRPAGVKKSLSGIFGDQRPGEQRGDGAAGRPWVPRHAEHLPSVRGRSHLRRRRGGGAGPGLSSTVAG